MRPQQQGRRQRNRGNNNNNNNNRRNQNPLSRSYESNGPDVKIRGNAQQVADKYEALARDAQASGDRVMAENYLQHAEHYKRILMAWQQTQSQEREQRSSNDDDNDQDNDDGVETDQPVVNGTPAEVALEEQEVVAEAKPARQRRQHQPKAEAQNDEGDAPSQDEGDARPQPKRRTRRPKQDAVSDEQAPQTAEGGAEAETAVEA